MDPNEILRFQLKRMHDASRAPDGSEEKYDALHEVYSCAADLDEWLRKGGFPPDRWNHGQWVGRDE